MPGVKTAISLEKDLFERVDKLAHEMHVSRSQLFSLAVKEYLKKQENIFFLEQLNKAYDDHPSDEEGILVKSMRGKQGNIVERESW